MRPERLEMAGFAPFRQPTEIDFAGLELFALTGPTGAGKSSVIDAITFALYGSVARYDRNRVGPVISLGAAEARVRFDFEVEGVSYTAARVVRRTPQGGASTAEARLESQGEVLASGAAEVTGAVESLLGLRIDHFTRSVVLPQGEFAGFLHDTPAGQQDLVKALLDMGVLDTVRRLASERARTARAVTEQAQVRLDQLGDATEETEKETAARLDALERLVETVEAAEQAIAESQSAARERGAEVEALAGRRELLVSAVIPDGVAELAETLSQLEDLVEKAEAESAMAEEALEQVTAEADELPASSVLETAAELEAQLADAKTRRDAIALEELEKAVALAHHQVETAGEARRAAAAELDERRNRHAAHSLVSGLSAGDPCPVCQQPLQDDPAAPPADLAEKETALETADSALAEASLHHHSAEKALAEAQATHRAAARSVAELMERMEQLPRGEELARITDARRQIDRRLAVAQVSYREAREAEAAIRRQRQQMDDARRQAWVEFGRARDRLAALSPPPGPQEDLARAWEELCEWAGGRLEEVDEKLLQVRAAVDDAHAAVEKQRDELERLLSEAGVDGTGSGSTRLAAAVATARAGLERIRERCAERKALEADLRWSEEQAHVATMLGTHLRADRFEGWLLAEALASLVDGANSLLVDLTAGAYSLALDGRAIEVVDHRNADEHRSVRSLSGGETFLVSLALALSLGEQLTNLSHRGGARLDAIFLDEGFGSLDAETLETVTVVVTELAAQGRTVGLVTHVKELAEQIPVRFEIKTGASGSTIDRIAS